MMFYYEEMGRISYFICRILYYKRLLYKGKQHVPLVRDGNEQNGVCGVLGICMDPNWDLEVPARRDTFKVLPNETKKISILYGANSIEGAVGEGKMKVFFLDADILDKLPVGRVPIESVLGSRIYTLEEIRAINFHFCFPFE